MDAPSKPCLLEQVRQQIRPRHYSLRTEKAYVYWIRRFVRFTGLRHPRELGAVEVPGFLTHLAVDVKVAASTQNQALAALLFLYREVLNRAGTARPRQRQDDHDLHARAEPRGKGEDPDVQSGLGGRVLLALVIAGRMGGIQYRDLGVTCRHHA